MIFYGRYLRKKTKKRFLDFGEICDCGPFNDNKDQSNGCCGCDTCQLNDGKQCSTLEKCCSETCMFEAATTVCRPAKHDDCDALETCTGSSGRCPTDGGVVIGTSCKYKNPVDSDMIQDST